MANSEALVNRIVILLDELFEDLRSYKANFLSLKFAHELNLQAKILIVLVSLLLFLRYTIRIS